MGETLESALNNLYQNEDLNNESLTYLTTMVNECHALCLVFWNQNEEMLGKFHELGLRDPDSVAKLLRVCSGTLRRSRDVLRDLALGPAELFEKYEDGDLEKTVEDWYVTFMSFIATTVKFVDAEDWVTHKANHIHMTDGGGGVSVYEHKVKLFMTLFFKAMDMQTFDRLHNSGGDSKSQISEQTVSGCARLTSYDCDLSASDGVSCSVASADDLAHKKVDTTEWKESHKDDLLRIGHENCKRFQKAVHGHVAMNAVMHCEHEPSGRTVDKLTEYGKCISDTTDALVSESMNDRTKPMHISTQRLKKYRTLHSVEQSRLRLALDKHLCSIKGGCEEHQGLPRDALNIGIMVAPTPKGIDETTGYFTYHDTSTQIISSAADIDDFSKNIPSIIISDHMNMHIADWYWGCWNQVRSLHSTEPKWPHIDWPVWAAELLQMWLTTIGFDREQLERHIVHLIHLKRNVVKVEKTHKIQIKKLFDSESDFIIEHSDELLSCDASLDTLDPAIKVWIHAKAEQLKLEEMTLRICAKEVALSVLNGSERSALDIEADDIDAEVQHQIYCICKQPYDDNEHWIQCSGCEGHYHRECVNLSFEAWCEQLHLRVMTWKCDDCSD